MGDNAIRQPGYIGSNVRFAYDGHKILDDIIAYTQGYVSTPGA